MTYAAKALAAARAYGLDIPAEVDEADQLQHAVHAAANTNPPEPPGLPTRARDLAPVLTAHGEDVRAHHAAQQAAITMRTPADQRLTHAVRDAVPAWINHLSRDYDTTIKQFASKARGVPDEAHEDRLAHLNPKQFGDWQTARKHAHTLDTIVRVRDTLARAAGEGGTQDKALFVAARLPDPPDDPSNWPDIAAHITTWRDRRADPVQRWAALTASPLTLTLAPVGAPLERAQAREQWRDNYINRNKPKRRK